MSILQTRTPRQSRDAWTGIGGWGRPRSYHHGGQLSNQTFLPGWVTRVTEWGALKAVLFSLLGKEGGAEQLVSLTVSPKLLCQSGDGPRYGWYPSLCAFQMCRCVSAHTHMLLTHRKKPCMEEGRDGSDVFTNQGMPGLAGNNQKSGEKPRTDSP